VSKGVDKCLDKGVDELYKFICYSKGMKITWESWNALDGEAKAAIKKRSERAALILRLDLAERQGLIDTKYPGQHEQVPYALFAKIEHVKQAIDDQHLKDPKVDWAFSGNMPRGTKAKLETFDWTWCNDVKNNSQAREKIEALNTLCKSIEFNQESPYDSIPLEDFFYEVSDKEPHVEADTWRNHPEFTSQAEWDNYMTKESGEQKEILAKLVNGKIDGLFDDVDNILKAGRAQAKLETRDSHLTYLRTLVTTLVTTKGLDITLKNPSELKDDLTRENEIKRILRALSNLGLGNLKRKEYIKVNELKSEYGV